MKTMQNILEKKVFEILAEGKGPNYTVYRIMELLFPEVQKHVDAKLKNEESKLA